MRIIIGLDPGLCGAAAIIAKDDSGAITLVDAVDFSTIGEGARRRIDAAMLRDWIMGHRPQHAGLERVGAMPGQGVASSFRFGTACGAIEATLALCQIPVTHISPVTWKRFHGLRGPRKEQSRQRALELLPHAHRLLNLKRHHQRAEACLIALVMLTLLDKAVTP